MHKINTFMVTCFLFRSDTQVFSDAFIILIRKSFGVQTHWAIYLHSSLTWAAVFDTKTKFICHQSLQSKFSLKNLSMGVTLADKKWDSNIGLHTYQCWCVPIKSILKHAYYLHRKVKVIDCMSWSCWPGELLLDIVRLQNNGNGWVVMLHQGNV